MGVSSSESPPYRGSASDCRGLTAGRRRTGAISSSSSEIVIDEWETALSSSSEITVGEWVLGGRTEARGGGGSTMAGATGDATDAEGPTEADILERSCSMKCV